MKISVENQGALYAILSGILYGLVGYFGIKLMASDLSIANMQFWRFFISSLFIALIFAHKIKLTHADIKAATNTFLFGGIFYSAAAGIYFVGSEYIGTGPSMVIFFTYPVMVMLLNWLLFKNQISKRYYFAVALIVLGMSQLVDLKEFKLDMLGLAFAVLSGLFYAFYIVCSKKIKISPILSTFFVSLGCALACLCYALWDSSFSMPSTMNQWLMILGFGIVTTAVPILLFLESLKKISSEKASILSVTEPLFVVFFGIVLLGEAINFTKMMGIITILSGALITLVNFKIKLPLPYKKEQTPV